MPTASSHAARRGRRAPAVAAAAAALCAAAAATPSAASAASVTHYQVHASGNGSYLLDIDHSDDGGIETSKVEATFGWTSFIPAVTFVDGRFSHVSAPPEGPTVMTGELKRAIRVISSRPGTTPIVVDCKGADLADQAMGSSPMSGVEGNPQGVVFKPFDVVSFTDHTCTDGIKEPFGIFQDGGDPHGIWEPGRFGEFDQVFELPPEAIGAGEITQWVKPLAGQVIPAQCPSYAQVPGERCTSRLEWAGSITFRKLPDDPTAPMPLVEPKTPPRFEGPPMQGPAPLDTGDDLIAPLVPAKASIDAKGKTLSFKAGCAAGCTGTATLTAGGKATARAAARRALVTLRFKVPAGKPRTVRLTLPAKSRKALKRAGRGTLVVTLKPKTGKARKVTIALKLPRR